MGGTPCRGHHAHFSMSAPSVRSSTTRSTSSTSLMQQRSGKRPLQWGPRRVRGSEHPRARPAFLTPRAVPGTRWGRVWALKACVVGQCGLEGLWVTSLCAVFLGLKYCRPACRPAAPLAKHQQRAR